MRSTRADELTSSFLKRAKKEMRFLEDEFGFRLDEADPTRARIRYLNATTGVALELDRREHDVFASVRRLAANGQRAGAVYDLEDVVPAKVRDEGKRPVDWVKSDA